jgi:hypothetical protein
MMLVCILFGYLYIPYNVASLSCVFATYERWKCALLSKKMEQLFTIGCAREVEEPITILGTIIAWEFLNCCRLSH